MPGDLGGLRLFQSLIESRGPSRPPWRPATLGTALGVHLCVLAVVVFGGGSDGLESGESPLKVTFLKFSQLNESEGVATATSPTGLARTSPEPIEVPAAAAPEIAQDQADLRKSANPVPPVEMLQPQKMPETIHTEPMPEAPMAAVAERDGALPGGMPGGVPGGIPGGIPGGVVGGQPLPAGPLRAGGAVSSPVVLERYQPDYPARARGARVEGEVVLEAVILRNGTVGEVRVVQGLRLGCTDAAIEALRRWRFLPGERYGVPVDVYFELTVEFILG